MLIAVRYNIKRVYTIYRQVYCKNIYEDHNKFDVNTTHRYGPSRIL